MTGPGLVVISAGQPLFRVYRSDYHPVWFCSCGGCRFDPSDGGACYTSTSMLGAFIEKFGRTKLVSDSFVARFSLAVLYSISDITALDLTDSRNLGLRRLTSDIQAGTDYAASQRVSGMVLAEGLSGIRYAARHDLSSELHSVAVLSDKTGVEDDRRLIVDSTMAVPDFLLRQAETRFNISVTPSNIIALQQEEQEDVSDSWELSDPPSD